MKCEFPDHYPPKCPPDPAQVPNGQTDYYRLVWNPLTLESMKSPYELGWANSDHCDGRALSLYKGPQGVRRLVNSYPWAAGGSVARICPQPDWGKLRTGSRKGAQTHTNFWLYSDVDRSAILLSMNLCEENE